MATSHPRIAVVQDPELDRALRVAEPLLTDVERRSQASRVRALAIRGAAALAAEHGDEDRMRLEAALDAIGATKATGRWEDLPPPINIGPPELRLGSAALDEARGDR